MVITNPSFQELELMLKDYKANANYESIAVSLKLNKGVSMGIVKDVKEVIRKNLYNK